MVRDGGLGVTRDVSASGMYLWVPSTWAVGHLLDFTVDMTLGGTAMRLFGRGEVVRVEPGDGAVGVAIRLAETHWQRLLRPEA